jgi:hypothetical protein
MFAQVLFEGHILEGGKPRKTFHCGRFPTGRPFVNSFGEGGQRIPLLVVGHAVGGRIFGVSVAILFGVSLPLQKQH